MLKYRIISGCLIGAAFVLAANYVPLIGAWVLLILISTLAQLEFYHIVNAGGIPVYRVLGVVSGGMLISATFWLMGPDLADLAAAHRAEQMVLLGTLIAVFIRQFPQKYNDKPIGTIACTLLGVWYVPFLFNYFTRLAFAWDGSESTRYVSVTGRMLILYLVVVVKISDVGAFFVGTFLGRHKLFPRISPRKTWEGLVGGIAAAVLTSWLFHRFTGGHLGRVSFAVRDAVILGVLLAGLGTVGDMFESLLKRAAGAKDSSEVIPGLGGILDVLDSLLFSAPALYVYARLFLT